MGVALNDVGPELDPAGLAGIMVYLGRKPAARSHAEAAMALPYVLKGFANVPPERWMQEAQTHFVQTPGGLEITYDPHLRDAVEAGGEVPDLWPFFDALGGLPLALIRGANSNLLSAETALEMRRRRPDMLYANIEGRGHVPFLDEADSVFTIQTWAAML